MKLIIIKPHETDEANQIFYQADVIISLLHIYYNIIKKTSVHNMGTGTQKPVSIGLMT